MLPNVQLCTCVHDAHPSQKPPFHPTRSWHARPRLLSPCLYSPNPARTQEVVLIENDINTSPFTPAVHECVPSLPWRVTEEHVQQLGRADLRHLAVCSVDPPGCKDIDDALHVRPLPNGNYELGVHIADVTHFLRPGSAMDVEAAARATTTYLVQRRIDMLPKPLTEDICSLRCEGACGRGGKRAKGAAPLRRAREGGRWSRARGHCCGLGWGRGLELEISVCLLSCPVGLQPSRGFNLRQGGWRCTKGYLRAGWGGAGSGRSN